MFENLATDKSARREMERFVSASGRDLDLAEALVEAALLAGACEAEVYLKTSVTSGILLQEGLATLAGGSERGVALRVFNATGNWGHAYASWGDSALSRRLVQSAMTALGASSAAGIPSAPAPRPLEPFPLIEGVLDPRVFRENPASKRSILERALKRPAQGWAPQFQASWRDGISRVALVNSRGLMASFHRTLALVTLTRAGGGGPILVAERLGCALGEPEILEAAEEIFQLEGIREGDGVVPNEILLQSTAVPVLMRRLEREILPAWAAGERVLSFGEDLGSSALSLSDEPRLPRGVASSPFDGEGHPTRSTSILNSGEIDRSWNTQNSLSRPTGRAIRPSYRDLPVQGWTNLVIAPGRRRRCEMLREINQGILLAVLDVEGGGDGWKAQARWSGIGWEVRSGQVVGSCKRFHFNLGVDALLRGVVEISCQGRFAFHRSTGWLCPDLLIRLST
jgi:PmbA protein